MASLFNDGDTQKQKLDALYPPLMKRRLEQGKKVESRTLAIVGLRNRVWPMLTKVEANIQLRTGDARQYLQSVDETGYQKGYKTKDRGRVTPSEVTQTEMAFDIECDCKSSAADRKKIRQKIVTYWFRYGERPPNVPDWIWIASDDDWMKGVRSGGSRPRPSA